jgi:hypothetical protein
MTDKPKHTPGPWKAIAGSVFTESDSPCFEIVHGKYLTRSGTEDQRMADAHLIAAAPQMAEALLQLVNGCPCSKYIDNPHRECEDCKQGREALRAAGVRE